MSPRRSVAVDPDASRFVTRVRPRDINAIRVTRPRRRLGVKVFSVDPYEIGDENPEAVDSGAFWFYRKLGFRAADPQVAKLVDPEESRMQREPGIPKLEADPGEACDRIHPV